jgi:transposase-like protein
MAKKRQKHSNEFKAKVALEAVKAVHSMSELGAKFRVHPTVISRWKNQLIENASGAFGEGLGERMKSEEEMTAHLYQKIGRLEMENDFLKKKL